MRSNNPLRSIIHSLLLSLHLPSASAQTCYGVGGSIALGATPCNPSSSTHSACCHNVDYCLTNGLCFDSGGDNLLSRQSCTDQSWNSQACPQYCMGDLGDYAALLPCYNTWGDTPHPWYCCGISSDALACCNNGSSFPVPVAKIILRTFSSLTAVGIIVNPTASTSASSASTSAYSSITTLPSSATPTPPTSSSKPTTGFLNLGLGLGIGLGVPFVLAILALLFYLLTELRSYNNLHKAVAAEPMAMAIAGQQMGIPSHDGLSPRGDGGGGEGRHELPPRWDGGGGEGHHELPPRWGGGGGEGRHELPQERMY
ncbi:MAG: hypothetical protein M1813_000092 [Trichoglossum hirsutum]|nr:MAG: hypothetical protein M1813_000092 [Trichoglossum hirsutum]